jgi:hypothetical protein
MGDGGCFGELALLIHVGFSGADGQIAAPCIACIASA